MTALERDLVSWLFVGGEEVRRRHHRKQRKPPPVVLTVGFKPHSAENRFILDFKPPNNYRLRIRNVQWRDEGR